MPIVHMPVDNSTLAITSIICAGLLFVYILVAADNEFRKPPIAATISIVAGGLLFWLGFIPIGLMITAAFALVVGIFRALKANVNQPNSPNKSAQQPSTRTNEQHVSPANHREKSETDLDNQKNTTNNYARIVGVIIGVLAVGALFVVMMGNNKTEPVINYTPSSNNIKTSVNTPSTTVPPNQPLVTTPIEAPVNPVLMQQCDSYATANKRKEPTLTYQEQREDYNKLYAFCFDEAKKLTQTTSMSTANNSKIETVSNELLQAYKMAKIDNETSRQHINKTWGDLIKTLTDNEKNGVLKLQRAWIKSKQNFCGKVVKNKSIDNLTPDELTAEIKLLECDSQANSERAAVLSETIQAQDEIAKIINAGGK